MVSGWVFVRAFILGDRGWAVDGLAGAASGANQGILHVFLVSVFALSLVGDGFAPVDDGFGAQLSSPRTCLNLCRGPESTCPSFFLAHLLAASAALWHWSIPG